MKKAYAKAFGHNIRRLRNERGLSQEQLAAKLQVAGCGDITRSALAKIEVAQRNLQLYELKALREVLNVPYDELFIEIK